MKSKSISNNWIPKILAIKLILCILVSRFKLIWFMRRGSIVITVVIHDPYAFCPSSLSNHINHRDYGVHIWINYNLVYGTTMPTTMRRANEPNKRISQKLMMSSSYHHVLSAIHNKPTIHSFCSHLANELLYVHIHSHT